MKKRICIGIGFAIILAIIVFFMYLLRPKLQSDEEDMLYSQIENIVLDEHQEKLQNYKVFLSLKRFGYDIKGDETYIYCWIQTESFFENEEGRVEMYHGSSMPYKFTFKNGKYVKYDVPKDGREYQQSITEIFPFSVRTKFDKVYEDDYLKNEIIKQVEEYYNIDIEQIYY